MSVPWTISVVAPDSAASCSARKSWTGAADGAAWAGAAARAPHDDGATHHPQRSADRPVHGTPRGFTARWCGAVCAMPQRRSRRAVTARYGTASPRPRARPARRVHGRMTACRWPPTDPEPSPGSRAGDAVLVGAITVVAALLALLGAGVDARPAADRPGPPRGRRRCWRRSCSSRPSSRPWRWPAANARRTPRPSSATWSAWCSCRWRACSGPAPSGPAGRARCSRSPRAVVGVMVWRLLQLWEATGA